MISEAMIHIPEGQGFSHAMKEDFAYEQLVLFTKGMDELRIPFSYNTNFTITIFCRGGMKQAFEVYALIDKIKNGI